MIKRTLFLFFFLFWNYFYLYIFFTSFILPQKITLYGGKILGFWSKFCLEIIFINKNSN